MPSDETKTEAIMRAALELFNQYGFHGTPVPMIAERAKVGAGTIYRSFPSKEALVNAIYQRWKQAIVNRMIAAFPSEAPPREQFRAVWTTMAEFALEHPAELAFLELHAHHPYLDETSRSIEAGLMKFGSEMVMRAQKARAVKDLDAQLLIELVNGAFLGIFRAGWDGRYKLSKSLFMHAEQCCWEAIRA